MTDIDIIKNKSNLADLVGKKFTTTGQGRYLKTTEHDSLVIDTQQQMYFWNSHSEHGDIIDWVGRHELGYDGNWNSTDPALFKQAVTWLAEAAGLPSPQFKPESIEERATRITNERLMQSAVEYYRHKMATEIQPVQYALERGFNYDTIDKYLGYADGYLWQTIQDDHRDAAASIGLIYRNDRGQWRDSIYRGCLVYIHYNHGKPVYLAGRTIGEKHHCNLRASKEMFWAVSHYKKPLIIVEGQADALSIMQLGGNGLALCGVNLAAFDPDMVSMFPAVYVAPDTGMPDTVNKIAAAMGPLVKIINLPAKDANEWLQSGAIPSDLDTQIKSAVTFLDTEIERISMLAGADLYDEMGPLFTKLAQLDLFQLNIYRSTICKKLQISQSDFGRLLKAARGTLPEDEEAAFAKGGQYETVDGWTVLHTFTDDGKKRITPLANGTAKILEEVLRDDGTNEPELDFIIAGELENGHHLPKLTIPANEFSSMKWMSKWGSRFILAAGRNAQDHLRAAVQHLSGTPHRRTIYTHTGWRKINDTWVYLTSEGALGIDDPSIQVDLKMGRAETNMDRYRLPLSPTSITEAMEHSLNFWNITAPSITVPMWAAMYLAPLSPFLMIDFGLWIHGKTGSMKSSYIATALAHFGGWQGKDAKTFLPSNFQSTANAILLNAFQAKDVPLVIDDFAPGATQREVRERDQTASNLLRSVGNKAARGRMRDGRHFQADFPPRCLAIITAEDLPPTQSTMARGIGVRVQTPPKGSEERRAIERRLTTAQTAESNFYPIAMAGYILWIQRHWNELAADLPQVAARYRDQMQQAGHSRLPDAFGKLMAAIDTALFFAIDVGALTTQQANDRKKIAFNAMNAMIREHGDAVEAVDACRIFQELLTEQLDARQWYLVDVDAPSTASPENSPIGACCAGYHDGSTVYLLTKTVTDVMMLHNRMGQPFPVGKNTLYQRMIENGWLMAADNKPSCTVYIPAVGTSPRVLKFKKSLLIGE